MNNTTNEQLAERLLAQAKFNDALDETCRALMEAAAERLIEDEETISSIEPFSTHDFFHGAP